MNVKEDYNKNGVAIIPQVFNQEQVNFMRAAAFMSLAKIHENIAYPHKALESKKVGKHQFPTLIFWHFLINKYLNAIRTDTRLLTIVRKFLGDNIKQLNNQVYFRLFNFYKPY
ncbi:hypothetical protein LC605_02350 [Nostoc sp. CHAB 5836]|uniref:hypothetical protein n=1 Tax=Nostoc sp. CHAB 5836 TaxID=2780404 RepID=UPI001E30A808|nr:hypothetical protein [Nostoc sp. CHAB 5836]MCC5613936.1 hypothetical protein [Nostoc sp. CHAB 5836]